MWEECLDTQPQRRKAKAGASRPAFQRKRKKLELIEGEEAFSRFQSVMKTILKGRGVSRDPAARTPS